MAQPRIRTPLRRRLMDGLIVLYFVDALASIASTSHGLISPVLMGLAAVALIVGMAYDSWVSPV